MQLHLNHIVKIAHILQIVKLNTNMDYKNCGICEVSKELFPTYCLKYKTNIKNKRYSTGLKDSGTKTFSGRCEECNCCDE